jgi:predicted flap endonuclease-1-like 5' DNA nuclease
MRESSAGSVGVGRARVVLAVALLSLALFSALMLQGVEPFATWFYLYAWVPTLIAADALVALTGGAGRRGEFLLLSRPRFLLSMAAWSAVIWLYYELINLRLLNWYYVFVPADRAMRWFFTFIAFGTVLPAVFLSEAVLDGLRVARNTRWRSLRMTPRLLLILQIIGVIAFLPLLIKPEWFYPLVWGAAAFVIEPIVYRKDPARSILGDLETGKPGRLLRLLLGGMLIGLTWELLNIRARTKWIYTVPGFEDTKLFEMPVLGFFGFPAFAVECFVLWQALVLAGVATPRDPAQRVVAPRARVLTAAALAGVFSLVVLAGMEGRTWDSYRPQLDALGAVPVRELEHAGYDAFSLANAQPEEVAGAAGASVTDAAQWVETARFVTLRGIGQQYAELLRQVGITDMEALARADADELANRLEMVSGRDIVPARVRVWVRGARAVVRTQSRDLMP